MEKHYQRAADNASAIACTLDLCQMNFMVFSVFRDLEHARVADTTLCERVHGFVIGRKKAPDLPGLFSTCRKN
jgi:hypothetical protein